MAERRVAYLYTKDEKSKKESQRFREGAHGQSTYQTYITSIRAVNLTPISIHFVYRQPSRTQYAPPTDLLICCGIGSSILHNGYFGILLIRSKRAG